MGSLSLRGRGGGRKEESPKETDLQGLCQGLKGAVAFSTHSPHPPPSICFFCPVDCSLINAKSAHPLHIPCMCADPFKRLWGGQGDAMKGNKSHLNGVSPPSLKGDIMTQSAPP